MPWQNNNDGGPWGGNDGEEGGDKPGPQNPWGQGPQRRPQRSGGNNDFDDLIKRSQEKLRAQFGGGGRGGGNWGNNLESNAGSLLAWAGAAIIAAWVVLTSFYRVDASERAVVMRLGRYVESTDPGLHFKLPWPIDSVEKRKVEELRSIDIGASDGSAENLMLTGDQNIINLAYTVRWKIRNPEQFLFELAEPEATVREVAESAMRAEIAGAGLGDAIGAQRAQIAERVRERMQELLDSYHAGIEVRGLDIKQADPPAAVDKAFKDVQAAQQDAQQYLNQARAYAQKLLANAQGSAAAFDAVYAQYKLAPEVTRKRMYLETMEQVLTKVDKTVIDTNNVQTYLPLPELKRRAASADGAQ
jgi:membrane protease subunit HflK